MNARETSREIDDSAARWVARVDRAPLSAAEEQALDAWLAGDARRLGAYAKACAVSIHSERARALGSNFDPARFAAYEPDSTRFRRRSILVGSAAAAVAAVSMVPRLLWHFRQGTISTLRGQTRVVPLVDGSVITLNTASTIAVDYSNERRDVRLLEGEALFDVAKDPARPFTVEAGHTQVRALGTSFTVLFVPQEPVRVLVREGVVELKRPDVQAASPVRIAANSRAIAPNDAPVTVRAAAASEINRDLYWLQGRIAFEGTTLQKAAETFARYSDTRIVFDDPSIAAEKITGLFVSNDPVGFSKAVAISLNLHADIGDGEVHLSR